MINARNFTAKIHKVKNLCVNLSAIKYGHNSKETVFLNAENEKIFHWLNLYQKNLCFLGLFAILRHKN